MTSLNYLTNCVIFLQPNPTQSHVQNVKTNDSVKHAICETLLAMFTHQHYHCIIPLACLIHFVNTPCQFINMKHIVVSIGKMTNGHKSNGFLPILAF
jgi:hypothetical protein